MKRPWIVSLQVYLDLDCMASKEGYLRTKSLYLPMDAKGKTEKRSSNLEADKIDYGYDPVKTKRQNSSASGSKPAVISSDSKQTDLDTIPDGCEVPTTQFKNSKQTSGYRYRNEHLPAAQLSEFEDDYLMESITCFKKQNSVIIATLI